MQQHREVPTFVHLHLRPSLASLMSAIRDYVYFERKPDLFSKATQENANSAKVRLEHYYKKAVEEVVERNTRFVGLFPPHMYE